MGNAVGVFGQGQGTETAENCHIGDAFGHAECEGNLRSVYMKTIGNLLNIFKNQIDKIIYRSQASYGMNAAFLFTPGESDFRLSLAS